MRCFSQHACGNRVLQAVGLSRCLTPRRRQNGYRWRYAAKPAVTSGRTGNHITVGLPCGWRRSRVCAVRPVVAARKDCSWSRLMPDPAPRRRTIKPRHLRKREHEFRSYRAVVVVKPGEWADVHHAGLRADTHHFTWDELKQLAAWLYTVVNFHEVPSENSMDSGRNSV